MTVVDGDALVYYVHHSEECVVVVVVVGVVMVDGIAFGVMMKSNDVIVAFSLSRSVVDWVRDVAVVNVVSSYRPPCKGLP